MEENNNQMVNPIPAQPQMPDVTKPKKPSKKTIVIIILAVILLAVLIVAYVLNSRRSKEVYPTIEQKVQDIEQTVQQTKELGLPSTKTQMDIMKYNAQQ